MLQDLGMTKVLLLLDAEGMRELLNGLDIETLTPCSLQQESLSSLGLTRRTRYLLTVEELEEA